jgi:hypothetical protein
MGDIGKKAHFHLVKAIHPLLLKPIEFDLIPLSGLNQGIPDK